MSNQDIIRSSIKTFLPGADENLVDLLVIKVEEDLNKHRRIKSSRLRNAIVQRVIKQEELLELSLK